jgi:hypothetical protein
MKIEIIEEQQATNPIITEKTEKSIREKEQKSLWAKIWIF